MAEFVMLVGLPASGKSTTCDRLKADDYIIHSSDAIREEVLKDVNDQSNNNLVFDTLHKRVITDLKNGKDVVYDACNIDYKRRMQFLDMIKNIECEKICMLMATPYDICCIRNHRRERSVPDWVITKMYKNFTIPQLYEGWDKVIIEWCNFLTDDFILQDLFYGENGLAYMNHDNPHHSETIGNHCKICQDIVGDSDYRMEIASLLHDIGKKFCKEFNDEKGHSTYYQHHLVGAYDSLFYLYKMGYINEDILYISNIIQWHMQPFFMNSDKAIDKFKKLVGEDVYKNILLLHEADKQAK